MILVFWGGVLRTGQPNNLACADFVNEIVIARTVSVIKCEPNRLNIHSHGTIELV